jgi:hypothetical protein
MASSAEFYRKNPVARAKKAAVDKAINSRPNQIKKRVECNRERRNARKKGKNIDQLDWDHHINKFVSIAKNRGRTVNGQREGKRNKK